MAQRMDVEPLDSPSVVQALAAEYLLARQPLSLLPLDGSALDADSAIDDEVLSVDELDLLLELAPPADENKGSVADISTTAADAAEDSLQQQQGAHGADEVALQVYESDGAEQPTAVVKVHPRRNRKRRKHEVDALRVEEKELTEKLKQLQKQVQQSASASQFDGRLTVKIKLSHKEGDCSPTRPGQLSVIENDRSADSSSLSGGIWESLAWFQREEVRASMEENTRLRAFYRDQLLMLKHLETMAPDQFFARNEMVTPEWLQQQLQVGGMSALATKRARRDPFDDDFALFASLGRDFDAQYAKTDSILEAAGLTNFDGRRKEEMVPKRGANGIYFLESVFSKLIPRDVHAHDETIWHVLASEQLHAHHGAYEVRELTHDVVLRKIVNKIRMPHEETTLIRRTALKRYIEEDRVVVVWDSVLEVTGSISMRLRERGWKVLRRPHVYPDDHDGVSPLSVEQLCVRITPELCSTYAEQDIAAGSLTNVIVSSYQQHLMMLHHLDKTAFKVFFKKAVETMMSKLRS